ncbi:XRE family transcriptional regulator [Caldanaerobacter subterraneus subsp. yonseiensis KB-1]|uniref:XRE family transcriptional regulator n=1 Tax=Caldanaerobacter subterraneus subsp. yonseiensis KB-1 TaxID=1388761 RepID=U5CV31_CALSX|nr:helix-turn-helix transcriptional regulator [Caldanaerobacter subterraneus]ERM91927.1 XRE family transcriptional regulator [Caldanaerobacter subterraneus subsp. yonseiensis KB-1]
MLYQEKIKYFLMRKQKKIKLREIAEYIGCSISLLSMFENNQIDMPTEKIQKYIEFIQNYPKNKRR